MDEPIDNLVTFKVREEQRDWAEDEQKRLRKAERKRYTQAELFELMRAAYVAAPGALPAKDLPTTPLSSTNTQSDVIGLLPEINQNVKAILGIVIKRGASIRNLASPGEDTAREAADTARRAEESVLGPDGDRQGGKPTVGTKKKNAPPAPGTPRRRRGTR